MPVLVNAIPFKLSFIFRFLFLVFLNLLLLCPWPFLCMFYLSKHGSDHQVSIFASQVSFYITTADGKVVTSACSIPVFKVGFIYQKISIKAYLMFRKSSWNEEAKHIHTQTFKYLFIIRHLKQSNGLYHSMLRNGYKTRNSWQRQDLMVF